MNKKVVFTRLNDDSLVASFYASEKEIHSKILNNAEIFSLANLVSLEVIPLQYDATQLLKLIDKNPFASKDGEPTGFELLLVDLIYRQ